MDTSTYFNPDDLIYNPSQPTLCQTIDKACPQCGSPMTEVNRRQENGTMYLWLECVESTCAHEHLDHFSCW